MLTKQQVHILGIWKKDLFTHVTFRQIKEQSHQKSNNIIQIALKKFKEYKLVETEQTGNVTTYFLNLNNNVTLSYLNLINEGEISKKNIPKEVLKNIQQKISKNTPFFILILFGSHAKNKARENSDLDIAVIVESKRTKKDLIPIIETIKRRELKVIDYHIFTKNEFGEMMKANAENVGKQIYKSNIIYYGFIEYCQMIRRAKNG